MRRFVKRAGLALLIGVLVQLASMASAILLRSELIALALILPGWVVLFAGRSPPGPWWGVPLMLLINAVVYAPFVYLALYWRPFREKEVLSIRAKRRRGAAG